MKFSLKQNKNKVIVLQSIGETGALSGSRKLKANQVNNIRKLIDQQMMFSGDNRKDKQALFLRKVTHNPSGYVKQLATEHNSRSKDALKTGKTKKLKQSSTVAGLNLKLR